MWRMTGDSLFLYYEPPGPLETEYRVGLCAWQDKSMLEEGHFYPIKSMRAEERLWWYSQFFDCVEVNSTFYAPLAAENAVRWVKRTPAGFLFSVKAYALLTGHHLDAARLPEPLKTMLPASARPNARGQFENKLFAREAYEWAFQTFSEALDYLAGLPDRLPGLTLAVEFRDASWLPAHTDEVLRFLAARGLSYVSVDAPRTPAGVATPVAVLRLHGRNAAGFLKQLHGASPSVAEKYGYLYNEAEIGEIVARGRGLAGHARRVYFKLNNNVGAAPAINGIQIRELLGLDN